MTRVADSHRNQLDPVYGPTLSSYYFKDSKFYGRNSVETRALRTFNLSKMLTLYEDIIFDRKNSILKLVLELVK